MTFWEHLKPRKRPPSATAVELSADRRVLTLAWEDGQRTSVTARKLRQSCPCAECVEEWTGRRTLDVASVPEDLTLNEVAPVGNYALSFVFGDAHRVGIFDWSYLRELSQERPAS